MDLHRVDLNLLVLFNHLIHERRVTKVAEILGVTQPTVSNSLGRLRKLMGDELFTPTRAGLVPTQLAEQLAGPVAQALAILQESLVQSSHFDPATFRRSMTIGMNDIGEIVFLPRLVERIRRDAPGVSLSTIRNVNTTLREGMESGAVDLAIGLLPQLKTGFYQRRLFSQRYVCLFRKGHPLDKKTLSLADFKSAEHLVVVSAGTGHGKIDELIERAGVERTVRLTVPNYVGVGHILRGTSLCATVPERLAQHLCETDTLVYRKHPVRLPDVAISVLWHAKVHRSPAHQWLRNIVFDLFADRGAEAG